MSDVEVRAYGRSGAGSYTVLERAFGERWQDEHNGPGVGQFSIHADDTQATLGHLNDLHVIKFVYAGAERFAFRIRQRQRVRVSSEEAAGQVITVSGPGVTGDLAYMDVPHQYGYHSPDVRSCTFAGTDGEWRNTGDWAAPLGSTHSTDTARSGLVVDWPTPTAQWIWPTDPTATYAQGSTAMFRKTFTTTGTTSVVLFSTADDILDMYLDEEHLVSSGSVESYTWESPNRHELVLSAGEHVLAAKVVQGTATASPAGLLVALHALKTDGTPGTLLVKSDTSWICTSDDAGWHPAVMLKHFVEQNDAAGVEPASNITIGFTKTTDSASVAFSGYVDREWRVGDSLLSVAQQLTEVGLDFAVGPDMVLRAWNHRGSPQPVELQEAVNLRSLTVTSTAPEATAFRVRTAQGWYVYGETVAQGTYGTWMQPLSLGEVDSNAVGNSIASSTAETTAYPSKAHTAEPAVLAGLVPYVDFNIGDEITAPGEWSGTVSLRIRSLTITVDDVGRLRCVPEFLEV